MYLLFHQINQNMWIRKKFCKIQPILIKFNIFLNFTCKYQVVIEFYRIFKCPPVSPLCGGCFNTPLPSPTAPLSFWGDRSVKITGKDWRALLQWNWRENWRSLLHAFYHILWHKNSKILMMKKRYLHIFYLSRVCKPLGLSLFRYTLKES